MRLDVQGGGVRMCLFLGQPAPACLTHTLHCVSATLLLPISSTADVAHSGLGKVMNCVVCVA